MPRRVGAYIALGVMASVNADPLLSPPEAATVAASPIPENNNAPTPEPDNVNSIPLAQAPPPPLAQPAAELEAVTVTAMKRTQTAQQVPGSIGVVKGSDLEKMGATDMESFLKLVPGVTLSKSDDGNDVPTIRGINTSTVPVNTAESTGIYIDDIPLSDPFLSSATIDLDPFDLDQVEVLKGPQGTLYGSSSLGGAIVYKMQKPQPGVIEAKLQFSDTALDGNGEFGPHAAAMVNLPLGTTSAIRAVGIGEKVPGYINDDERGLKNVNSDKKYQGRIEWLWAPISSLSFNATYLRQESKQADAGFADQTSQLERSDTPTASPSNVAFTVGNLLAKYKPAWAELTSSTSWFDKTFNMFTDVSRTFPAELMAIPGLEDHETFNISTNSFAQEVRLASPEKESASFNWLVGAFYLRSAQSFFQITPIPQYALGDGLPLVDPNSLVGLTGAETLLTAAGLGPNDLNVLYGTVNDVAKEYALFGDITYRFWKHWELTLGGRLFRTTEDASVVNSGYESLQVSAPDQAVSQTNQFGTSQEGFDPRASLRFEFNRNASIYALASRGFQFGGAQLYAPNPTEQALANGAPIPRTYSSSTLWNYEFGTKTEWFQHRLGLDATFFYERWTNLQIEQQADNGLINYVSNVGRAHSVGTEFSLRTHPIRSITFGTSVALIHAVTDVPFDGAAGEVPQGTRLPASSRFQIASVLGYDQPIHGFVAGASVTHTFMGHSFNDLYGTVKLGNYETLDARVHLQRQGEMFQPDLSLGVNNALNIKGLSGANAAPGQTYEDIYFIRPRAIVLSLSLQFY